MTLNIQSLPVSEENYAETMKNIVEPELAQLRKEDFFKGFDLPLIHISELTGPY